jgi:pimeloyl-ACP methyl ester carboxylesterase
MTMTNEPTAIVLIHGAGAGRWSWEPVIPRLQAAGHRVIAPSLSGWTDRATTLSDHIAEARTLFEEADLHDVLLVGHSYGGMVITGLAEAVPDRIAQLIFLDAVYPRDGEASFDCLPELAAVLVPLAVDGLMPAPSPEDIGVDTEEQAELVRRHQLSIPLGCTQQPVRRTAAQAAIPRRYILATRSGMEAMAERARNDDARYYEIDAAHMLTITAPEETARLLLDLAAEQTASALAS